MRVLQEQIMKIGVLAFLTEQSGNPGAIAREAENLGFESFWVAEHMVMPSHYTVHYPRSADGKVPEFYAHLIDPFVALAMAAQATSRIRIGTAICLLPERNVIETAKAAACIDLYSGGRLSFGIGAGWFPEEARVMGVDFARRWRHLRESVEALRSLWSRDDVSYDGEIVKFPPVRLYPRPVQKPGIEEEQKRSPKGCYYSESGGSKNSKFVSRVLQAIIECYVFQERDTNFSIGRI